MSRETELQNLIEHLESVHEIFETVWNSLRWCNWQLNLTAPMKSVLLRRLSLIQGEFADWRSAYERLAYSNRPEIKVLILEKMFHTAKTAADWRFLFTKSTPLPERQCEILENLLCSADNIEDLFFVRKNIGEDSILKDCAEQKIITLCTTFELCLQALKKCENKQSDFAKRIMEKSDGMEVSFEELCHAKKYHCRNLLVRTLIISKFSKLKTSLKNWMLLLKNTSENCPLRAVVLIRIKQSCC
jgi:hypothetical protein